MYEFFFTRVVPCKLDGTNYKGGQKTAEDKMSKYFCSEGKKVEKKTDRLVLEIGWPERLHGDAVYSEI